ncbi:MAG: thermonuclease family protein [Verrucomicrobia bacterium]|nr:thermonuclease family protein [Verrucomicrobiota bacterium]
MLLLLVAGWVATGSAEAKWRTYTDCQVIANPANDGDSFHTKRGRRHHIYRLYFVDTPESDTFLEERIDEQAAYWKVPPERIQKLAKEATAFTADFLKNGYRVTTQMEDARGNSDRPRYFAFVEVGDMDLAEALVEAGLARIYGRMVDQPDGLSLNRYRKRLEAAERRARDRKAGAWGLKSDAGGRSRFGATYPARTGESRTPTLDRSAWTNTPARDLVLSHPLAVYSLRTTNLVTVLKKGTPVHVLGAESLMMLRVRFAVDDKVYEALCRRSNLTP